VEFNIADMPGANCWARGNSGVIILNRYEVQIPDSYRSDMGGPSPAQGSPHFGPLVNACRATVSWG
jgi:hypothetical protein